MIDQEQPLFEKLKHLLEEEVKILEEIEKRVATPIAFHHRDFHTTVKDAVHNSEKAKELLEGIEKKLEDAKKEPEKAAQIGTELPEDYANLVKELGHVDENITIALLSTIFILRKAREYYDSRFMLAEELEGLGSELENVGLTNHPEIVENIKKRLEATREEMKALHIDLERATHRTAPQSALLKAASEAAKVFEDEGVKSWVERRRQAAKTSGKADA